MLSLTKTIGKDPSLSDIYSSGEINKRGCNWIIPSYSVSYLFKATKRS